MKIEELLKEKGKLIDDELKAVFPNELSNLHDAVWYHMNTGGKRVRPVLAIATCEALGGDADKIIPFAASCEVFHNWALVHDDIEDGDKVRRDQPAVWVKYGIDHGINIGDYMSDKVYELILRSKEKGLDSDTILKLTEIMVSTAVNTAEGQTMDMNFRTTIPTEEDYMKMVTLKTGFYLTVPIIGGAVVAGAKEDMLQRIMKFGDYAGPAFQMVDDILDLTVGKGRGEIGRDIKEGKRSILAIHCLGKCTEEEKEKIIDILNKKPDETTNEDVEYVKSLYEKYDSINYAKSKSEKLIQKAKDEIKDFPEELKLILDEFADYLVKRDK